MNEAGQETALVRSFGREVEGATRAQNAAAAQDEDALRDAGSAIVAESGRFKAERSCVR